MALMNHAGVLKIFWATIESYDKDPVLIFDELDLDIKLAEDPSARISYTKVEELWKKTINLADDPCLGLRIASIWHPSTSGALGYAWLASSSLRESFERLVLFSRVASDFTDISIEEENDKFSAIISYNRPQQFSLNYALFLDRYNYHFAWFSSSLRCVVHINQ